MNIVTSPRAEKLSSTMALPVIYDVETFELYGYKHWVLDEKAATRILCENAIYKTCESFAVAMGILEQRVSRLNEK